MGLRSDEERHVFPHVLAYRRVRIQAGTAHSVLIGLVVIHEAPIGIVHDVDVAHCIERLRQGESNSTLWSGHKMSDLCCQRGRAVRHDHNLVADHEMTKVNLRCFSVGFLVFISDKVGAAPLLCSGFIRYMICTPFFLNDFHLHPFAELSS
jgi:hypothetical protein